MGASPHVRSSSPGREPAAAPARLGRFELIERIGAGGMAEVFRAAVKGPEGFHRELVVKRILPELSARPRFTQMFVNEAKISALLSHPNIVQIFEFGESDGVYFIAMESVRGLTLREVLTKLRQQGRTMPVVAAAEIAREVLIALDYAHNLRDADGRALDIVHRDVSPSNVMIADTGVVKVLDFGIARAADLVDDDEGKVVKGKISYLAPEQITCGDIDARVDVFAVGCVLHEILTGRVMFRAQNDLQKKIDLLAQPSQPPSAWNSEVPPALDLCVARATARDPNARYTSAADMLADVENYLASFRSSSRAVLRLVRSLADLPSPDGEGTQGRGATATGGQSTTGRGPFATTGHGPSATTGRGPSATTGRGRSATTGHGPSATEALASATSTRAMVPLPEDFEPRASSDGRPARVDRTEEGRSSSAGRSEIQPTGTNAARFGGAASAEGRRFARGVWNRRLVLIAMAALCLVVLGGVVAGGRALWGRVAQSGLGMSRVPAKADPFILVTFVSTPPGARIVDGAGRVVGTTPATLPVRPSQIVVSFRFQLEGFTETTASAVPDVDKTVSVELKPKPAEKPARRSRSSKRAAPGRG